ncbi:MAG: DNA polymerase I, partial [Candidatus Andersenbacteria bacterium]|nr:DNA polymerase I [Candidatus Andersenbacteria bacterium]
GQYGSIEEIYKHLDELSERARNSLTGHKDEALKYRRLATIDCKVPIKFNLDEAEMDDYDAEEVRRVFERLEFRTLLTRLPKSKHPAQPTLFKNVAEEKDASEVKLPDNYHLVQSEAEQKELMARLRREKVIGFDTENDRLGAREYPIVGMSFAAGTGPNMEAWYVPVTRESVRKWRGVLENKEVGKVGHNLKYDVEVLRRAGVGLDGIVFDSMLASYLLRPGIRQHGLDLVAGQELGHHAIPITDLIGEGKQQKTMSEVPLPELARYAAEDAELALRLYEKLSGSIKKEGLTRVLNELELPLILVLADMELTGVKLDSTLLKKMSKKVGARLDTLRQKIWQEAGEEFNVNSTQQLREILFNKLNLSTEGIKKTQTGFSTAAAELDKLHGQHPIIELIEEQRELSKLQNTYLETLPELADKETGRVYTSFNQTVAATGRLSSSDPNLQNIPARTPLGQEIRAAFTAGAGKVLVKADYSQVELRLAAHMSGDEKMLDTFRAGEDIHTATAAWVHGVKLSEVTAKQRRAAKTLNFGVLYGMGPQKFARSSGLSMEEARSFIERYKEQYKGVTALIARTVEQAESLGYVETLFGRRRYIPEINSRTPVVRAAAERAAFNFPLQGTAADILKKAMVELFAHLQKNYPATKMVLTVHDELVCETPADGADKVAADMKRIMEGVFTLDIPLVVDVGMGRNWRDMR